MEPVQIKANAKLRDKVYLGNEMQYNTRKLLLERILMFIASHKVHTISLFVANYSIKILHIHFITIYYKQNENMRELHKFVPLY